MLLIVFISCLYRASDRSPKKKSNFAGFLGTKSREKSADFAGIFGANLAGKQLVKKRRILWLFLGRILPEIDRFCTD